MLEVEVRVGPLHQAPQYGLAWEVLRAQPRAEDLQAWAALALPAVGAKQELLFASLHAVEAVLSHAGCVARIEAMAAAALARLRWGGVGPGTTAGLRAQAAAFPALGQIASRPAGGGEEGLEAALRMCQGDAEIHIFASGAGQSARVLAAQPLPPGCRSQLVSAYDQIEGDPPPAALVSLLQGLPCYDPAVGVRFARVRLHCRSGNAVRASLRALQASRADGATPGGVVWIAHGKTAAEAVAALSLPEEPAP